jgi:hypothetical protein
MEERFKGYVGALGYKVRARFDVESNIVDMSFMFINLMKDGSYELFDETHRIRLFTFPEMSQILAQNGFKVVQGYNWDQNKSDLKPFARAI